MKKLQLTVFLMLSSLLLLAQGNTFLIYSFKGDVYVVENSVSQKAQTGKLLDSEAIIRLGSGASVSLICNEAAMFAISKPGSYPMKKFGNSCKVADNSVSSKYAKYVWAQLTKNTGSPGSNRKAFMNTVGAVSRSINNIWIDPRLDTVNYASGEFSLSWKSYAEAKEFDFFLYNAEDTENPIYTATLKSLAIPIENFKDKIAAGNTYYWTAAVKGESNEELKVLHFIPQKIYETALGKMKSEQMYPESAAEQAYRVAFMLEDAHYLSEAYQHYQKAAALAPSVSLYRSTLMSFKKDYDIK